MKVSNYLFEQQWQTAKKSHPENGFEIVEHGWEQHVLVDHAKNLVYRYPRNKNAFNKLTDEVAVLRELHQATFNVAIPVLREHTADYTVYDYIPGDVLSDDIIADLTDEQLASIGHDLGIFFSILHSTSPDVVKSKATRQTTSLYDYYARRIEGAKTADFYEKAHDTLLSIAGDTNDQVVVHGDLHGLNIVIDPVTKNLSGIIDFSELELGNRHQDFRKPFMTDSRLLGPAINAYEQHCDIKLSKEKIIAWAYVNEWANIAYFKDTPENPTYLRAFKHLRKWQQI